MDMGMETLVMNKRLPLGEFGDRKLEDCHITFIKLVNCL